MGGDCSTASSPRNYTSIGVNTLSLVAFKSPSYPVPEGFECNRKKLISFEFF
jgi:hypothetical protein